MRGRKQNTTLATLAKIDPESFDSRVCSTDFFDYIDLSSVAAPGAPAVPRRIHKSEAPSRAQRLVSRGDILIANVRPNLRNFTIVSAVQEDVPTVASTGFTVVRPRVNADGSFIYQLVLSRAFYSWVKPRMTGSGYPAISSKDVAAFPVPSDVELFRKRARLLDCLDDTIENTRKLANQTSRLKAALAQDLLVHAMRKKRVSVHPTKLGQLFSERAERGRPGLPTISVTMNAGIMDREDMDRRIDSALTPGEHLLAKTGDIAYNMMRMWQGVSGLVPQDSLVSPAYVVVTPEPNIDAGFAAHFFKLPETIRLFRRYSQGLTDDRLRLYFHQFAEIPVTIPKNISDQKRIARLLDTMDETVAKHESTLAALIRAKTAISNEIFEHP